PLRRQCSSVAASVAGHGEADVRLRAEQVIGRERRHRRQFAVVAGIVDDRDLERGRRGGPQRRDALHAAVNHRREAERFWSERKCAEFNALPLAERKARVEAHERVTQRILEGPPESLTTAEEQVKWQNDVFRALLPSGVVVDKRTYRATVRMDRE